jgi:hypothetical protein
MLGVVDTVLNGCKVEGAVGRIFEQFTAEFLSIYEYLDNLLQVLKTAASVIILCCLITLGVLYVLKKMWRDQVHIEIQVKPSPTSQGMLQTLASRRVNPYVPQYNL